MKNKVEIKYTEQRWEGFEAWIGSDHTYWVRLDFLLESFISKNVDLSKKFKGQLNDFNIAKKYYESLFDKFMKTTSNGEEFNYDNYLNWQKNNKIEVARAITNINLQAIFNNYFHNLNTISDNNGFDGVYVKKDALDNVIDIIINEVKQVNSGAVKLSPPTTSLPFTQMTDGWIDNVIARMKLPNTSQEIKNLATLIENGKNQGKITKVVTGIDKVNDEILVFTIK